ncbi:uncharacterized protein LOC120189746 [Hibiscus syriacus]|uniref:uncharacterized protein LOC120189746 n=1 Tax=Hibiscus syriacus TaxID=106335 RepID=UPI001923AE2A|nr:uncharacterized protein LOC120189746 [Hibiscus syriacus]
MIADEIDKIRFVGPVCSLYSFEFFVIEDIELLLQAIVCCSKSFTLLDYFSSTQSFSLHISLLLRCHRHLRPHFSSWWIYVTWLPDGAVTVEDDAAADETSVVEETSSPISSLLQSYKEALASNDESNVADIEASLKSIEDGKIDFEKKMASLLEELLTGKEWFLGLVQTLTTFARGCREIAFLLYEMPKESLVACFG